jgi:hypothetical protein
MDTTGTGTTGSTYGDTDTTTGTAGSTYGNDADAGGLPNTASELPLFGLLGALSLAGALALKASR